MGGKVLSHIHGQINRLMEVGQYINGYGLIPHLVHLASMAHKDQPEEEFPEVWALFDFSKYLEKAGRYSPGEAIALNCWKRVEKSKGPDHPDVASTLNNLAGLYSSLGKYDQAEPLYQRALKILGNRLGFDHPNTRTVQRNYDDFKRKK